MILVSKADPLSRGIPHVHMRAAAQCARREWGSNVARVEVGFHARLVDLHDYPLSVPRTILPIRSRLLRAEDEGHFPGVRMKRNDSTVRAVFCPVQLSYLLGHYVNHCNGVAVKHRAV